MRAAVIGNPFGEEETTSRQNSPTQPELGGLLVCHGQCRDVVQHGRERPEATRGERLFSRFLEFFQRYRVRQLEWSNRGPG